MALPPPALLALDFDGVVCDGRPEYFETAWRACVEMLGAPRTPPAELAARFAARRPLIESGWEMPLLAHALRAGVAAAALRDRRAWRTAARRLLEETGVTAEALGTALDRVRDEWFARDPGGWLAHHRFYPGVIERLDALAGGPPRVVVVTTKAERFARALLASRSARLADVAIFGREPGRVVPKPETLRRLVAAHALPDGGAGLWFVEDLLETLEAVRAASGLGGARLFLATWGYNTLEDRAAASLRRHLTPLSLARFAGPFASWVA